MEHHRNRLTGLRGQLHFWTVNLAIVGHAVRGQFLSRKISER
jgi:hypothetical protein